MSDSGEGSSTFSAFFSDSPAPAAGTTDVDLERDAPVVAVDTARFETEVASGEPFFAFPPVTDATTAGLKVLADVVAVSLDLAALGLAAVVRPLGLGGAFAFAAGYARNQ